MGNKPREYIDTQMSFKLTNEMKLARILVNLDIREGLWSQIELKHQGITYVKIFYYEGISF